MRKILVLLLLLFSTISFSSVPLKNKINIIANPSDKNVCIMIINQIENKTDKKYVFLANISDLSLIDKQNIEDIALIGSDQKFFQDTKKKYLPTSNNIEAIIILRIKEGKKLPNKFYNLP